MQGFEREAGQAKMSWRGGGAPGGGASFTPFELRSIPYVRALLLLLTAVFLLFFLATGLRAAIAELLTFEAAGRGDLSWLTRPWTLLLYALFSVHPLPLLFQGYWLYMVGGTLERSWGGRNFAVVTGALTLASALGMLLASQIFDVPVALQGPALALGSLTVAWAAMDPDMPIYFWALIPVKLKYLAFISVAVTYFSYGLSSGALGPLMALGTLAGPAAAWFYVRKAPRLNIGFRAPRDSMSSRFQTLLKNRERAPFQERIPPSGPVRSRQQRVDEERLRRLLGEDEPEAPVN